MRLEPNSKRIKEKYLDDINNRLKNQELRNPHNVYCGDFLILTSMQIENLYSLYLKSNGVSTDSRTVEQGQLFIALPGENFDGNKFALDALKKGAIKAVVDDPAIVGSDDFILVENTLSCLQELAQFHRKTYNIPVIAITGSNGKTTTKELTAAVLSQKFKIHYTRGNFNNHIGVPLTLLEMPDDAEIAIIEMGANHIGEIKALCEIAEPNFGMITNISGAHLEGFGSIEGVITAKTELYKHLESTGGIAFVNSLDPVLMNNKPANLKYIEYQKGQTVQSKLELKSQQNPYLSIQYSLQEGEGVINTKLYGDYNYINICAAICIGEEFLVDHNRIIDGIESYIPQNNRSQLITWRDNKFVLDAYNANPASMRVSIEHFANAFDGPKILILGEMAELGKYNTDEHKALVEFTMQWKWETVFLIGNNFQSTNLSGYHKFLNTEQLIAFLAKYDMPDKFAMLLKGSRVVKLEDMVNWFMK